MSACESCHAGCCRSFAVPVTGADILRIERDRGVTFWEFACRWADPHGIIARKYAPHFHFKDEPQTPFVICLTHVASETFPGTTKCQFLGETPPSEEHPRGLGKCTIYESRPGACRAFPTKLNSTNELAIVYDVPERGRTQDSEAFTLCPRPWEPEDLDPIDTLQSLVVARYEMNFFQQLAKVWNRQPRAWEIFPEFLRVAYAGRIVKETEEEPRTIPFPVKSTPAAQEPDQRRRAA